MESADWLISTALVTSSIIAVTANSFLLLIFCRKRGLRTVSNRFVINLLITNLLSSVLLIPLMIVDQSQTGLMYADEENKNNNNTIKSPPNEEIIIHDQVIEFENRTTSLEIIESTLTVIIGTGETRRILCHVAQFSTSFISTLSIISILLIGVNQYFGVIHSLRYHAYINKCRSTIAIATAWVVALIASIISTLTEVDAPLWGFCQSSDNASAVVQTLGTLYSGVYFLLVILGPFVAICGIYVCIYRAAHHNSRRMHAILPKARSAPDFRWCNSGRLDRVPRSVPNFAQVDETVEIDNKNKWGGESRDDGASKAQNMFHLGDDGDDSVQRIYEVYQKDSCDVQGPLPRIKVQEHGGIEEVEEQVSTRPEHRVPRLSKISECSTDDQISVAITPIPRVDSFPQVLSVLSPQTQKRNFITSLKHKISNASMFRSREETRAAKVSMLVIFLVLFCYIPYGLVLVLNSGLVALRTPRNDICLVFLVLSNVMSPFLFAYRNRRVKCEMGRLLGITGSGTRAPAPSRRRSVENASQPFLLDCEHHRGGAVVGNRGRIGRGVLSWSNGDGDFIPVPCMEGRGSFSSASTQISNEE